MRIADFNRQVAIHEGLKEGVSIAQINEIVKIINELTSGEFYKTIKGLNLDGSLGSSKKKVVSKKVNAKSKKAIVSKKR